MLEFPFLSTLEIEPIAIPSKTLNGFILGACQQGDMIEIGGLNIELINDFAHQASDSLAYACLPFVNIATPPAVAPNVVIINDAKSVDSSSTFSCISFGPAATQAGWRQLPALIKRSKSSLLMIIGGGNEGEVSLAQRLERAEPHLKAANLQVIYAVKASDESIILQLAHPEVSSDPSPFYIQLTDALAQSGNIEASLTILKALALKEAADAQLIAHYIKALIRLKNLEEAEEVLSDCLSLNKETLSAHERAQFSLLEARLKNRQNYPEEALAIIDPLLSEDPNNVEALKIAQLACKKLREYELSAEYLERLYHLTNDPHFAAQLKLRKPMATIRPEFRAMDFSELLIQHLIDEHDFETVLDVGSGAGQQAEALRRHSKQVTELDYGGSVYFENAQTSRPNDVIIGDFLTIDIPQQYDCVLASHVLEHQLNVHAFLTKIHATLKEGGVLGITVPPAKPQIVGGHVTLWNAGLLLYNLVLAGFNCRNVWLRCYGYNISIVLKKETVQPKGLVFDFGDVNAIGPYLPPGLSEGFNGDIHELG